MNSISQLCSDALHNEDCKENFVLDAIFYTVERNTVSKTQGGDFGLSHKSLPTYLLLRTLWCNDVI